MAPSVTVKSTPNQSGTDLFILHEGRKVIIKDNTMKEWKEIKLEEVSGWYLPMLLKSFKHNQWIYNST